MVEIDTGDNANLPILFWCFEFLGDGFKNRRAIRGDIDNAAIGFLAAGNGGSSGSRVRAKRCAVVGVLGSNNGELMKLMWLNGRFNFAGQSAVVVRGSLNLRVADLVANKKTYLGAPLVVLAAFGSVVGVCKRRAAALAHASRKSPEAAAPVNPAAPRKKSRRDNEDIVFVPFLCM